MDFQIQQALHRYNADQTLENAQRFINAYRRVDPPPVFIDKPLTVAQLRNQATQIEPSGNNDCDNVYFQVVVAFGLSEIMPHQFINGWEYFHDLLAEAVCEDSLAYDVEFKPVGALEDGRILFQLEGYIEDYRDEDA